MTLVVARTLKSRRDTGYYLLKARKVFLYVGRSNSLPTECLVLSDIAPPDIAARLTEAVGVDLRWLLIITGAAASHTTTTERRPLRTHGPSGIGFEVLVHANTFPPASSVV